MIITILKYFSYRLRSLRQKYCFLKEKRYSQIFILTSSLLFLAINFQNCESPTEKIESQSHSEIKTSEATPITTTTVTVTTTTNTTVDIEIQLPSMGFGSERMPDCHTNPEFNACIFKRKYPLHMSDPPTENLFGVNILGTSTNDALENASYKISAFWDNAPLKKAALTKGKWTKSNLNDINKTGHQASVYHWLMYQKEWMELNAGTFYAKDGSINVKLMDKNTFSDEYNIVGWVNGLWHPGTNTIALRIDEDDLFFEGNSFETLLHESGHANLTYSNENEGHYSTSTQKECKRVLSESICCNTYKGCIAAINEGQAEFHAYLISPDKDLYIHPFSKKFSNYPCDDGRMSHVSVKLKLSRA